MAMQSGVQTQPALSTVLETYLTAKGDSFQAKSAGGVTRALGVVFKTVGDMPLGAYVREDARRVRDALLKMA